MKITEIAWLAGFIDGEGCITSCKSDKFHRQYVVTVSNSDSRNTDKALAILKSIPGVEASVRSSLSPQGYPMHEVKTGKKESLVALLPIIIPYLIGKREQAELLHEHLIWRMKKRKSFPYIKHANGGGSVRMTEEVKQKDSLVHEKLKHMKKYFRTPV